MVQDETEIHVPISEQEITPATVAQLVVQEGAKAGMVFDLTQDTTTIGRHPDSDIFLSDLTVSRRHAEVRKAGSAFEICDSGSLNGTYVNRQRVDAAKLNLGDVVQVGRFKLLYKSPAS